MVLSEEEKKGWKVRVGGFGAGFRHVQFFPIPSQAYDDFVLFCVLRSTDDKDEIVKEWKTKSRGGEGG